MIWEPPGGRGSFILWAMLRLHRGIYIEGVRLEANVS